MRAAWALAPGLLLAAGRAWLAARAGDPTMGLVLLGAATGLLGWGHGILAGTHPRRLLPAVAAFPAATAVLTGLAAAAGIPCCPGVRPGLAAGVGVLDGLLAGAVFLVFARLGDDLARRQGRRDALAAWALAGVVSGAILWLLGSALRAARGLSAPPAWPALAVAAPLAAWAGAGFMRRHGWSAATVNLMLGMLPAFAGLLGLVEGALLAAGGDPDRAFPPRFLALVFVPVWLAAGLGLYLVGAAGAVVGALRARAGDGRPPGPGGPGHG